MFPHTTWQSVHSLSKISWGKITSECLPCIRLAQESQWNSLSLKLNLWILCSSSDTLVGPSQPGSLTRSWGPFLPVYGFVLGHIFRESTWCVPVSQSFSMSLSAFKPLSAHLRALWHCLGHHLATQVAQQLRTNNHYAKQTPTGLNSLLRQQHFRTGLPPPDKPLEASEASHGEHHKCAFLINDGVFSPFHTSSPALSTVHLSNPCPHWK